MAKQILVLVIDPERMEIRADTVEDSLRSKQAMVGGSIQPVYIDLPRADEVMWVNESGKLRANHFFEIKGFRDTFAGTCYICGETEGGNDRDTALCIADIEDKIVWRPDLAGAEIL